MYILRLFIPLAVFSLYHTAAAPIIKPTDRSCREPFPVLKSEILDTGDPWDTDADFWNFDASNRPGSGGTPAYSVSNQYTNQLPILDSWNIINASEDKQPDPTEEELFHRYQLKNATTYPFNTIGKLSFQRFKGDKGGWCTGTLVGSNILLTASHCFPWGYGSERWMRFVPGFGHNDATEPYGGSYVSRCRGAKNTYKVTGVDYIICHLCDPLGDRIGWMGTQWWDDEQIYMNGSWFSSGYPVETFNGETQTLITNLSLIDVDRHGQLGVELESDVFASPGWSGGPMWGYIGGEPRIVGVCSGGERDCSERPGGCFVANDNEPYHDVSAGGNLMVELVYYALTNWAI